MKWISVKERLPEYEQEIWMLCKTFGTVGYSKLFHKIGCRKSTDKKGNVFQSETGESYRDDNGLDIILYWMPVELPQPPKK